LPEIIGNASSSLAFSADGQYLFYMNKNVETLLAYQLMRHKLGTGVSEDVLVYEEKDNIDHLVWVLVASSNYFPFSTYVRKQS